MASIVIRKARLEDDLEALLSVVNQAYRVRSGTGKAWTTEGDLIVGDRITWDGMRDKLNGGVLRVLIAEDSETKQCVGCVEIASVEAEKGVVSIGMLSVDPWRQGDGIGRKLFDEAERIAWGEEIGAQTIRLWVLAMRDSLIGWYERRGFSATGLYEDFPPPSATVGRPREEALNLYSDKFRFAIYEKQRACQ